jgi:hypothetical protein
MRSSAMNSDKQYGTPALHPWFSPPSTSLKNESGVAVGGARFGPAGLELDGRAKSKMDHETKSTMKRYREQIAL